MEAQASTEYTLDVHGKYVWKKNGHTTTKFQKPPEVVEDVLVCHTCRHEDTYYFYRYAASWYTKHVKNVCSKCGSSELSGKINSVPTVVFHGSDFVINNLAMKAAGAPQRVIDKHRNSRAL